MFLVDLQIGPSVMEVLKVEQLVFFEVKVEEFRSKKTQRRRRVRAGSNNDAIQPNVEHINDDRNQVDLNMADNEINVNLAVSSQSHTTETAIATTAIKTSQTKNLRNKRPKKQRMTIKTSHAQNTNKLEEQRTAQAALHQIVADISQVQLAELKQIMKAVNNRLDSTSNIRPPDN